MTNRRSESGETLLEIIMALVIIGLVVSAYFATFSTQASGSSLQRNLVTADGLLRNYAEATKSAVRANCGTSPTFTPTMPTLPTGFSVSASTNACPGSVSTDSASRYHGHDAQRRNEDPQDLREMQRQPRADWS